MDCVILEAWLEFAVRWVHVITAIAWIGSSFYFIALDLGLRQADDLDPKAHGKNGRCMAADFTTFKNIWWRRIVCQNT